MTAGQQKPLNRRQWVLAALAEYETRLARYATRLLRDEAAAQDAVQHTFLHLCDETPESLEGRLAAWLFRVCRNKALDLARAQGKVESLDAACSANGHEDHGQREYTNGAAVLGREPDPAQLAESGELHEMLRSLVSGLPDNQREAIDLWAEGFTHRQIGEITNKSQGNTRILVHRALDRLRNHPSVRRWLHDEPVRTPAITHL